MNNKDIYWKGNTLYVKDEPFIELTEDSKHKDMYWLDCFIKLPQEEDIFDDYYNLTRAMEAARRVAEVWLEDQEKGLETTKIVYRTK